MKFRYFAVLLFACFTANLFAGQSYSAMYVFGDSYCDTGTISIATGGTYPPPPYYQGRFSNGPLWVEAVAGQFSLPVTPGIAGGSNFAIGGSQLLQSGFIPSIVLEVQYYLYLHGGHADPNALYVLEGGGNDILDATSGSPEQLGYSVGLALGLLEVQLRQAGGRHFMMSNLLDVGTLPVSANHAAFATTASMTANTTLQGMIATEQALYGTQIFSVDVFSFLHDVQANPSHYGLKDVTTPCLDGSNQVCADPDHTLFWDAVHLTQAGNDLLATLAEGQVHP